MLVVACVVARAEEGGQGGSKSDTVAIERSLNFIGLIDHELLNLSNSQLTTILRAESAADYQWYEGNPPENKLAPCEIHLKFLTLDLFPSTKDSKAFKAPLRS